MLLNIPPFLHLLIPLLCVYSLQEVKSGNKTYYRIFKMALPRCDILKTSFSKAIRRYEPKLFPNNQEAIRTCKSFVRNMLKDNLTNIILFTPYYL